MSNYEDRTLLRLRRQYSKDETVAALSKKLSQKEIEIGVLKDTIESYKEEVQKIQKTNERQEKDNKALRTNLSALNRQVSYLENDLKESDIYKRINNQIEQVKLQNQTLRLRLREEINKQL